MSQALALKFKPADPVIRWRQKGKWMITFVELNPMPGVIQTLKSRVDLTQVERALRSGDISGLDISEDEIAGFFGSLWKGIKKVGKGIGKVVKKVGKVTGLNKVLKFAGKLGKIPGISAIPGVGLALKGISVAKDVSTAILAKKKGRPELAKKALRVAMKRAKAAGLTEKDAARQGVKMYKLIIAA